jgi:hypothetical protein
MQLQSSGQHIESRGPHVHGRPQPPVLSVLATEAQGVEQNRTAHLLIPPRRTTKSGGDSSRSRTKNQADADITAKLEGPRLKTSLSRHRFDATD